MQYPFVHLLSLILSEKLKTISLNTNIVVPSHRVFTEAHMKIRLFAMLAAIAVSVALLVYIGAKWEPKVFAQPAPTPSQHDMCEGASPIPSGYVITNEVGSPQCNYPTPGVTGRMLTIRVPKYMPPPLTICADAPVPSGYIVTAFAASPGHCRLITSTPNGTPGDQMIKTLQAVGPYPITNANGKKAAQ
jgi:hypothetical protein